MVGVGSGLGLAVDEGQMGIRKFIGFALGIAGFTVLI